MFDPSTSTIGLQKSGAPFLFTKLGVGTFLSVLHLLCKSNHVCGLLFCIMG